MPLIDIQSMEMEMRTARGEDDSVLIFLYNQLAKQVELSKAMVTDPTVMHLNVEYGMLQKLIAIRFETI